MPTRRKIQVKRTKKKLHASRYKSAPEKLERLIELVNDIPAGVKLKPFEEIDKEVEAGIHNRWFKVQEILFAHLAAFPKVLAYLNGEPPYDDRAIINPPLRYKNFRTSRYKLMTVAHYISYSNSETLITHPAINYSLRGTMSFDLDKQGRVTFYMDDLFSQAIEDVEVDRIRECLNPHCRKVFWAGRSNLVCCTHKCAHAYRNQRYRARYRDPQDDYKNRKQDATERHRSKTREKE